MHTQQNSHLHFLHVMWLIDVRRQRILNGKSCLDVLATSVLLDRRLTLCAFLGIRLEPVGSLGVIGTLLLPHLDDFAENRAMTIGVAAPRKAITFVRSSKWIHLPET